MSEIRTVEDIRRRSGWRETLEERQNYESEKRKRELAEEHERQQARKAREVEAASTSWYGAVDDRIHEHLRNWLWAAIDERGERKRELLKDGLGAALGTTRAEVRKEFEAKLAVLEERLAANSPAAWVSWIDGRIEAMLAHERDVLIEATGGAQLRALREEFKHSIGELCDAFGSEIAALEQRLKAVPGRLPVVKVYCPDTVHYAGHVVVHRGATYQALRDTARAPPHVDDWACIASAGCDGQSVRVRGAFNTTANYKRFDIVSLDGTAFIARCDNPGVCPGSGDGWQALALRGKAGDRGLSGPRGMKGERGARGEATPTITVWTVDRKRYRVIPSMSDGTFGAPLELRELFEQFVEETGHAVE
jgi:hypothetical protein